MNRWRITFGIAACVALMLGMIAWRWLFQPFPDERQAFALYVAHEQEFGALQKMVEGHCTGQLTPEATAVASRVDPRMLVVCDYNGTVRFILGVRGLMTIGPERIIGLIYIPSAPGRQGIVVPRLRPHQQDVGNVYLRQVDNRWYVFTQNTD